MLSQCIKWLAKMLWSCQSIWCMYSFVLYTTFSFSTDEPPVDIAAARVVYKKLRSLLGTQGSEENVVPQTVYLYPIKFFKVDPALELLKVSHVTWHVYGMSVYARKLLTESHWIELAENFRYSRYLKMSQYGLK